VTWWKDHALLDGLSEDISEGQVVNELRIVKLQREDLHTLLTCQAANNNISVPVSTSVKLDMQCELGQTFEAGWAHGCDD
jgi:neural cell adhesion molecule